MSSPWDDGSYLDVIADAGDLCRIKRQIEGRIRDALTTRATIAAYLSEDVSAKSQKKNAHATHTYARSQPQSKPER